MQTIAWKKGKVRIIDQTVLPGRLRYIELANIRQVWWAIRKMQVRGAPAIGIAAAFGVVLAMRNSQAKTWPKFHRQLQAAIRYLKQARPTAINLFWALELMEKEVRACSGQNIISLERLILKLALAILQGDKDNCRKMAGYGVKLVQDGDRILTHCNAGGLATADYGTALGVIYQAKAQGKRFKVYADETRPVLQGARLTAWELIRRKIDVTLICDNMAAQLISSGRVNKIFVGADRIAANGDAANKIGTYNLAVLASFHHIPFYIAAPVSSFDFRLRSGKQIPIEQRDPREVREILGKQIAPRNVKVYNPAFDVTPNKLISAIITERGILRQPFRQGIKALIAKR